MPQNFFLKLSVLWLWPVSNFTAPECVFPPFRPFPAFLGGFHWISLNTVQLRIYLPPWVSDLWPPRGSSQHPDTCAVSTTKLFALEKYQPTFAQSPRGCATSSSSALIYDTFGCRVLLFSNGGVAPVLRHLLASKYLGPMSPPKLKKKKKGKYIGW